MKVMQCLTLEGGRRTEWQAKAGKATSRKGADRIAPKS